LTSALRTLHYQCFQKFSAAQENGFVRTVERFAPSPGLKSVHKSASWEGGRRDHVWEMDPFGKRKKRSACGDLI
jgi:hypothetical protein